MAFDARSCQINDRDESCLRHSIEGLFLQSPKASARYVLDQRQVWWCRGLIAIGFVLTLLNPVAMLVIFLSSVSLFFVLATVFRAVLVAMSAGRPTEEAPQPIDPQYIYPCVTILLPLFDEADSLPALIRAISEINYPLDRLDVKLITEEEDLKTQRAITAIKLNPSFDHIIVPKSHPQTKPKACNFALHYAVGDLVVIYDAEDLPDRDQLLIAAQTFDRADHTLACVQARLNYYNATESWLTRLFTLEYSMWFDWLLPSLQALDAPIPLGGTSNVFRRKDLIEVGGWDPYNVTEDADLGLRLARAGKRTALIGSTTYEEANCQLKNWLRQRSRWMKGYLQTWLVHLRHGETNARELGWRGDLTAHLFVAGTVFSALVSPLLWLICIATIFIDARLIDVLFPGPLKAINFAALFLGNTLMITLLAVAPIKRRQFHLIPWALTAPAYWLLASLAAYKGLWQLMTRPHYWEKTDHGLSRDAVALQRDALKTMAGSTRYAFHGRNKSIRR
ncbi:MAG: glycosyltransferase family 2 protein [Pseudomonadota bacterium]